MSSAVVWRPVCPIPTKFNVEARIRLLKDQLNPQYPHYRAGQRDNLLKLIELYEAGKVPAGIRIYLVEGKVVDFETAMSSPGFVLSEVFQ